MILFCTESLGVPLHENRFSVRLRLFPCITDFTQIAMAEDSLNRRVFCTFLIQEQNRSGNLGPTISSTLLEEWILTVLHM